jgi:hypothetical protein
MLVATVCYETLYAKAADFVKKNTNWDLRHVDHLFSHDYITASLTESKVEGRKSKVQVAADVLPAQGRQAVLSHVWRRM